MRSEQKKDRKTSCWQRALGMGKKNVEKERREESSYFF